MSLAIRLPFLPDIRLAEYATWKRFNWPLFSTYLLLHATLVFAPQSYTWQGLCVGLIMYFCTTCLGITLCYHRMLAHRSYEAHPALKYFLTLCGCLAYQRGPIWWVACHRLHHSKVDTDLDPHTPKVSIWWSHFLWPFFWHPQLDESYETTRRLARDMDADPVMRFYEKAYPFINVGFLGLLYGLGYLYAGPAMAWSFLVWGGFVRLVYTLNVTWFVNSVAHIWGYRTYDTPDTSRNNWWVALLTFGEGWHNNHHHNARAARNGHQWYELDVTYMIILMLKHLGLAKKVVPVTRGEVAKVRCDAQAA